MMKSDEYNKAIGLEQLQEWYNQLPVTPDNKIGMPREKQLENMILNFGPQVDNF